jgi:hypothetical protein
LGLTSSWPSISLEQKIEIELEPLSSQKSLPPRAGFQSGSRFLLLALVAVN